MKRLSIAAVAVGLSVALVAGCARPEEAGALDAINGDRAAHGLWGLHQDPTLVGKAQRWAQHLLDTSGGQCSTATLRHSDLRDNAPIGWRYLGENVGCRIGPGDVHSHIGPLEQAFMNSPGHRANILDGRFGAAAVGIAFAPSSIAPGWLIVYEAQEFVQL